MANPAKAKRTAAEVFTRMESDVYALLDMTRETMDALDQKANRNDWGQAEELMRARNYLVSALAEVSGKNPDTILDALGATHEGE